MAKTVADVLKLVKENEVKFVDFRFTDTRGKEQHVTVPVSAFDEGKFSDGHAFDGSSIAGWKGIEASDMQLMPDPNTANIDPFYEETTLILTCDVVDPADGKPYERDPRSLAKRAEAYMKASGLGDTAFFGPEPRILRVRRRALAKRHVGLLRQDRIGRSRLEHGQGIRARQHRPSPGGQGRLLSGAPGRQLSGHALRNVPGARIARHPSRSASPRSGQRRPDGAWHQVQHVDPARRLGAAAEIRDPQRGARLRQDRHLHAQADRRRQRLRDARPPIGLERRQEPVRRRRLRGPQRIRAALHRRHHQACACLECDHQPRHQQLQASGARIRSPGQAGVLCQESLGVDPHSVRGEPEGPPPSRRASRIR